MAPWFLCLGIREHAASAAVYKAGSRSYSNAVIYLFLSSNYKQRSLYGFRMSTLVGWVGGDSFKYDHNSICVHLTNAKVFESFSGQFTSLHKDHPYSSRFVQFSSSQWTLVSVRRHRFGWLVTNGSSAIIVQRLIYGNVPPPMTVGEEDDLEQALALAGE